MSLSEWEKQTLDKLLDRLVAIEQGINTATRDLVSIKQDIKSFLQQLHIAREDC